MEMMIKVASKIEAGPSIAHVLATLSVYLGPITLVA